MSFREKCAWIELVAVAGVYGAYFILFGQATSLAYLIGPAVGVVVVLAVLMSVLMAVAAATAPTEAGAPYDERQRLIDLAAGRAGFYAVQTGVFFAIVAVWLGWTAPSLVNALLAVMVLGQLVRAGWQVVAYRRGAA